MCDCSRPFGGKQAFRSKSSFLTASFLLQNGWLSRYGAESQASRDRNRRCHLRGTEVIFGSTK